MVTRACNENSLNNSESNQKGRKKLSSCFKRRLIFSHLVLLINDPANAVRLKPTAIVEIGIEAYFRFQCAVRRRESARAIHYAGVPSGNPGLVKSSSAEPT